VRGSRIKNIVEELGGERIDIVRWNDSLQVMIPNALQPAGVEEVFLYPRLGRAIVMVKEDQLSLAIGRRGQNVRLASKLVGWDIEIMTLDELNEGIERAEGWFGRIPGMSSELVEAFITEGFLSFDDLTFMEPAELAELGGIDEEFAMVIIEFAENESARLEREGDVAPEEEEDENAGRGVASQFAAPENGEAAPEEGGEPIADEALATENDLQEQQEEEAAPAGDEAAPPEVPEEEPALQPHAGEGQL
jgi:transcription termination/antitermination protein NusA